MSWFGSPGPPPRSSRGEPLSEWIDLVAAADMVPESSRVFTLAEGIEVALFHVDGALHAADNMCTHQGGPIGEGEVKGSRVACPWHGWRFDLRSGECLQHPGHRLPIYEVRQREGWIQVRGPGLKDRRTPPPDPAPGPV